MERQTYGCNEGWQLSPAYDINPSIDKDSLALTIDSDSGNLDFDLAHSVGDYFRLNDKQMNAILKDVIAAVGQWKNVAATSALRELNKN